jgi:hypothetical protein
MKVFVVARPAANGLVTGAALETETSGEREDASDLVGTLVKQPKY